MKQCFPNPGVQGTLPFIFKRISYTLICLLQIISVQQKLLNWPSIEMSQAEYVDLKKFFKFGFKQRNNVYGMKISGKRVPELGSGAAKNSVTHGDKVGRRN